MRSIQINIKRNQKSKHPLFHPDSQLVSPLLHVTNPDQNDDTCTMPIIKKQTLLPLIIKNLHASENGNVNLNCFHLHSQRYFFFPQSTTLIYLQAIIIRSD